LTCGDQHKYTKPLYETCANIFSSTRIWSYVEKLSEIDSGLNQLHLFNPIIVNCIYPIAIIHE
jgi:hypothetical protein